MIVKHAHRLKSSQMECASLVMTINILMERNARIATHPVKHAQDLHQTSVKLVHMVYIWMELNAQPVYHLVLIVKQQ